MTIVRSRQSGITLVGFVIVMAVVGFFAFLFMKLFPAYNEYFNVVSAMEAVSSEPGASRKSPKEIFDSLEKRMYVNYVDRKYVDRRSFQLKRAGAGYTLAVKYERREPLIYNLDYVAMFDRTVQVGTSSSDQN